MASIVNKRKETISENNNIPELANKRRSTIFEKINIELTQSSVIQEKISPGKFPTSGVGIVKVLVILLLLGAAISFITLDSCPNTSKWYDWMFTVATCLGATVTIIFYAVFTLGLALMYPRFWFISDIVLSVALTIFVIVTSIMTMGDCKATGTAYKVPGPLAICGSVLLIIASAGLYIMYRHKETIPVVQPARIQPANNIADC